MKAKHVMETVAVMALMASLVSAVAGCARSVRAATDRTISGVRAEAEEMAVPERDTGTEQEYPVYSHETNDPYYLPACRYIMEEYGTFFEKEDIMLPFVNILRVDNSDPGDIRVWGNYAVCNYAKRGRTLMMRSGGSFPGLIHMKQDGDSILGTAMDL